MVVFGRGVNKKGEITTKEILEIVLGAAAVLVLIFLIFSLLVGSFDKDEETAATICRRMHCIVSGRWTRTRPAPPSGIYK